MKRSKIPPTRLSDEAAQETEKSPPPCDAHTTALQIGPVVVWASQLNQVLASYYLFNALIVSGRKDVEAQMRKTLLQSQTLSIVAEVLWSALHPSTVSPRTSIVCSVLFLVFQVANLTVAFGAAAFEETAYQFEFALLVQCAANLVVVPVAQIGHNWTLETRTSPARYRSMAVWCASCLALAVLLAPGVMASPIVAVSAGVLPMLAVTLLLARTPSLKEVRAPRAEEQPAEKISKPDKVSRGKTPDAVHIGLLPSLAFLFLGCCAGTVGEAMTDMAVTLALRKHLRAGRGDLAIANQAAVILSMLLAYYTETRPGGGGGNFTVFFMLLWGACQVFRSLCQGYLESGGIGVFVFFGLVFVGRYVGPLGKAAQDSALLQLLKNSSTNSPAAGATSWYRRVGIPKTLLWTMRMAGARLERPLCQLILLHAAGLLPVPQVAGAFTVISCLGVLAIVSFVADHQQVVVSTEKKKQ